MFVFIFLSLVLFINELMYYPYIYIYICRSMPMYIMYMIHACADSYVFAVHAVNAPLAYKSV